MACFRKNSFILHLPSTKHQKLDKKDLIFFSALKCHSLQQKKVTYLSVGLNLLILKNSLSYVINLQQYLTYLRDSVILYIVKENEDKHT
jgi:hypothetical protein